MNAWIVTFAPSHSHQRKDDEPGKMNNSRPQFPPGPWPIRLQPAYAAAYVGERSVKKFMEGVDRGEYPRPAVARGAGRGKLLLWLRSDLDRFVRDALEEVEV